MGIFDSLFEQARQAAVESIHEPSVHDDVDTVADQILEGAFYAIEAVLPSPDDVDAEWCKAMIDARPALLKREVAHGTMAAGLINTVADLLLDELEADILERAREKGFDIPVPPAP